MTFSRAFDPRAFDSRAFAVGPILANSSNIENAILARLGGDPILLSLMPNGAYYGIAPARMTRYVTVALEGSDDVAAFGRRVQEDLRVRVVAVGLSSALPSADVMDDAAHRIDELLEDEPIAVDGFTWATIYRMGRIRETDRDFGNPELVWYLRGGIYRVVYATGTR